MRGGQIYHGMWTVLDQRNRLSTTQAYALSDMMMQTQVFMAHVTSHAAGARGVTWVRWSRR